MSVVTSDFSIFWRIRNKVANIVSPIIGFDHVSRLQVVRRRELERLGSNYGGWVVPVSELSPDSIVYCVGCGEDISFDLALIDRFGCEVFAFDPTPRAIEHVATLTSDLDAYHFEPVGLWDTQTTLRFYEPSQSEHVSHSLLNLHGTEGYIEVPVKPLSQLMVENTHDRIDLLKIDIEGAEYNVIRSILEKCLPVRILCVEYDEYLSPLDGDYKVRIANSMRDLAAAGYSLISIQGNGNYTFCRYDW